MCFASTPGWPRLAAGALPSICLITYTSSGSPFSTLLLSKDRKTTDKLSQSGGCHLVITQSVPARRIQHYGCDRALSRSVFSIFDRFLSKAEIGLKSSVLKSRRGRSFRSGSPCLSRSLVKLFSFKTLLVLHVAVNATPGLL